LIAEGLARAPLLTPRGVKEGLEKVAPAAGRQRRAAHAHEPRALRHKAYKGDWLVIRRIERGRTVFVGLHEPE